jgi:rod shape-determining protein MreB
MLHYFINKVCGKFRALKPELLIGVPAGITSTERRAVVEAGLAAGAKAVFIAKEPILAAIGAGIPINSCSGHMVIDIGGGTTEVAVISLGGIVASNSIRMAGDKIDDAISDHVKKKFNLAVGAQTAEEIKIRIGSAITEKEQKYLEVRGRDMISGLPRMVKVSSNNVAAAATEVLKEIVQSVKSVLRETPPELSADIMDKGMVLAGGGAQLRNLDVLISQSTGVPCFVAEDSILCVAKGTGAVLENLDAYKKSVMSRK